MISLRLFKKIMQHVKEQEQIDEQLTKLLVCKESNGFISTADTLIDDILKLLQEIFDDKYETIEWWFWEISDNHKFIYENGVKYDLNDLDSLYYYLTGELDAIPQSEYKEEDLPKTIELNGEEFIDVLQEEWSKK